jgi:hypothetical protein
MTPNCSAIPVSLTKCAFFADAGIWRTAAASGGLCGRDNHVCRAARNLSFCETGQGCFWRSNSRIESGRNLFETVTVCAHREDFDYDLCLFGIDCPDRARVVTIASTTCTRPTLHTTCSTAMSFHPDLLPIVLIDNAVHRKEQLALFAL